MEQVWGVRWLRGHPRAADAALAGLLAVVSVVFHLTFHDASIHRPSVWGVVLTLGATVPVAWRRHAPVVVLIAVTLSQMIMEAFNLAGPGWTGVLVAAYSLGAYRSGVLLWRLALAAVAVITVFIIVGVAHGDAPWQALVSTPIVFISAIVFGDGVRRRRERAVEMAERIERAERERELLAHQRVHDERARIARELHDVVAHNVSLMVIQAAGARRQLASDAARADAALATVENTGRLAMHEMRRILGVLRDDQGMIAVAPQPRLGDIGELIGNSGDLPVSLHAAIDLGDIPAGIELSAYRIVQESLTNVRRHAGRVDRVDVSVSRHDGSLVIEVIDDGRGASADSSVEPGLGLIGMRERVAAFEGDLSAGPRAGGGWRVRASIPLGAG